jgi:hypothetical protein
MKKIILLFLILVNVSACQERFQKESANDKIISELNKVAKSLGYEFVYGDKYPIINPYGSYGSPCVFNIELNNESENVLFLCRKPNEFYRKNTQETINDLVNSYDYVLIFATKKVNELEYKIQNIIDKEIGLKGLYLNYDIVNKELDDFTNVNNETQIGPKGKYADFRSGSIPVFVSSESALLIFYYYNGNWFKYIENDD